MPEIIPGCLFQIDASTDAIERLVREARAPTLLVDLVGIAPHSIPSRDGLAYVRWPIEDGPLPDRNMLWAIQRCAITIIEQGGSVITMCNMGHNRSGLLSTLIVGRMLGLSGSEALKHVRSKCPDAVRNAVFQAFLLES